MFHDGNGIVPRMVARTAGIKLGGRVLSENGIYAAPLQYDLRAERPRYSMSVNKRRSVMMREGVVPLHTVFDLLTVTSRVTPPFLSLSLAPWKLCRPAAVRLATRAAGYE